MFRDLWGNTCWLDHTGERVADVSRRYLTSGKLHLNIYYVNQRSCQSWLIFFLNCVRIFDDCAYRTTVLPIELHLLFCFSTFLMKQESEISGSFLQTLGGVMCYVLFTYWWYCIHIYFIYLLTYLEGSILYIYIYRITIASSPLSGHSKSFKSVLAIKIELNSFKRVHNKCLVA